MFRLAAADNWIWLLSLPLLVLWWQWLDGKKHRWLTAWLGARRSGQLLSAGAGRRRWFERAVLALAGLCCLAGLARPQAGLTGARETVRGLDIELVVDSSRSMGAADDIPDRLGRAKRALFYVLDRLAGHRFGLVTFAGIAFERCPLTQDVGALKLLVDSMTTADLPVAGTDLRQAVTTALGAFARRPNAASLPGVMVLVTDGENFGGSPLDLVKQAAEAGVRTFILSVGSGQGAPVPPREDSSSPPSGNKLTRLQERPMQLLALAGGGAYIHLTPVGHEEEALVSALDRLERGELVSTTTTIWDDQYPWLAGAAALLLLLNLVWGRGRPAAVRRKKTWSRGTAAFSAVLALTLLPLTAAAVSRTAALAQGQAAMSKNNFPDAVKWFQAAAAESPRDPLAAFDLGCAYLAQFDYNRAYPACKAAAERARGTLAPDAWYNLGYAAFYLGLKEARAERLVESAQAFEQVLWQNPGDAEARYNLELVWRLIQKHTLSAARHEVQSQGSSRGQQPGSGAEGPGDDQQKTNGQDRDQAPPGEAQETTSQRQPEGNRTSTSEEARGKRQKGMSTQDALRTLRSLEADEQDMSKPQQPASARTNPYHGPDW